VRGGVVAANPPPHTSHRRPGPPWLAIVCVLSKRLHSLYMLRLFNDCWCVAFTLASIALAMRRQVSITRE